MSPIVISRTPECLREHNTRNSMPTLLNTIKVPGNLRYLTDMLPKANYVKPLSALRQRPYKKPEELRTERSVDGIPDLVKLPGRMRRPTRDGIEEKENRRPTPLESLKNVNKNPIRYGNNEEKLLDR